MNRNLCLLVALLMLLLPTTVAAQVTITFTFTNGTTADADQVNANFTVLGSQALNRTGGTITGNITVAGGVTIDGVDVGVQACTTCTPTHSTLTLTSIGASALDVAGGINAGTGNVGIVDTTGKIPALTSSFFTSLAFDAANLTGTAAAINGSLITALNASQLTTGTVGDARLSANVPLLSASNTFGGATNTFSNAVVANSLQVTGVGALTLTGASAGVETGSTAGANTPFIDFHSSGNVIDYDARIIAIGGTAGVGNGSLTFSAAGGINLGGLTSLTTGYFKDLSTATVSATTAGSTIDPGTTASLLYVTATGAGAGTIATINNGVDGRLLKVCIATGTGGLGGFTATGNIAVATSTLSGGQCAQFVYRASDGKWYLLSF